MNAAMLKRALVEKRVSAVLVVGLALCAGVVWGGGVYPLAGRVEAARLRAETAARQLDEAGAARTAAERLRGNAVAVEADLHRFYDMVLPVDLTAARGITYAKLSDLAARHRLVMERRSVTQEREGDGPLMRLETTMLLAGAWADLRRFMHALEAAEEFLVIEGILLGQREAGNSPLALTLDVATYYRDRSAT